MDLLSSFFGNGNMDPRFFAFLNAGDHIMLERLDTQIPHDPTARTRIDEYCARSEAHKAFFLFHKDITETVFGTWNYDKIKSHE